MLAVRKMKSSFNLFKAAAVVAACRDQMNNYEVFLIKYNSIVVQSSNKASFLVVSLQYQCFQSTVSSI